MKDQIHVSDRFVLGKKLGQGTFSFIYEAFDKLLQRNVALKIEKKDKNKNILMFEYSVLGCLKGLKHVCGAYDFVKNAEQNLIVMDLLGNNLAKVRKCLEENYSLKISIQLLIEMLDAIEEVHDRGFIHRDVKASNFVLSKDNKQVFIVDFGLAKRHLMDDLKNPVPARKKADFRGTVSFASLNAHNNIDLSRRDDLWSLYFVILDFLNEKLLWREQKKEKLAPNEDPSYSMEEVRQIKTECIINNPHEKLWRGQTRNIEEVRTIFYHLMGLKYEDKPNYKLIRENLRSILIRNQSIGRPIPHQQNMCMLPNPFQTSQGIVQQGIGHSRQSFIDNAFNSNFMGCSTSLQPITADERDPQNYIPHSSNTLIANQQQQPLSRAQYAATSSDMAPLPITSQINPEDHDPAQMKKRDTKNKAQNLKVNVVPPLVSQPVGLIPQMFQPSQPQDLQPAINFQTGNPACVNQHISISQNFYLSPHFLLLQNGSEQLIPGQNIPMMGTSTTQGAMAPNQQGPYPYVQPLIGNPSIISKAEGIIPQPSVHSPAFIIPSPPQQVSQPPQIMPQSSFAIAQKSTNQQMEAVRHSTQNMMPLKLQQAQQAYGTQNMAAELMKLQLLMVNKPQNPGKQGINQTQTNAAVYRYDPRRIEQKLPIFRIEKLQ